MIRAEFQLSNDFSMSAPTEADIPHLVRHLNDPYIFDRTLMLPANYGEKDARFFLTLCDSHQTLFGHPLHFSIRNSNGETIGGAGYHGKNSIAGLKHRDEIGYWLATEYRGKGIMTEAIQKLVEYGFGLRELLRIEAPVYAFNEPSAAVLLRCGFKLEGRLQKAYLRNGTYHDADLFAIVK